MAALFPIGHHCHIQIQPTRMGDTPAVEVQNEIPAAKKKHML